MADLQNCYCQIHEILRGEIEPIESVFLVERYRQYWRPDKVKVVLLAESHVFTNDEDRRILLQQTATEPLPDYPQQYAKFVYCLAYGERALTADSRHPPRDGTPQFWKIFYSCCNYVSNHDDFRPILKKTQFTERISNKVELLKKLKKRGIWLVDASIVALYDKSNKPSQLGRIIRKSWDGWVRRVVEETHPDYLICVGSGVNNILQNDLNALLGSRHCTIPQPQARIPSREQIRNFQKYYYVCQQYAPFNDRD